MVISIRFDGNMHKEKLKLAQNVGKNFKGLST